MYEGGVSLVDEVISSILEARGQSEAPPPEVRVHHQPMLLQCLCVICVVMEMHPLTSAVV